MRSQLWVPLTVLVIIGAGCGADPPVSEQSSTPSSSATTPSTQTSERPNPLADQPIDGSFSVGGDRELKLRCYGHGEPALVLEAGTDSSGFDVFPTLFLARLAEHTMTCVHDRAGTGRSDEPPEVRRTIDDAVAELESLLDAAGVPKPYLLVGSSGGALIDVQYAATHPDQIAGLVLIDAGVPSPHLDEEFPGELGWRNPEHLDWVDAELRMSMLPMPIGDFPTLIIQADGSAQGGSTTDQSYWLDLSPKARLEVMPGGHDLYQETPSEVAAQILSLLSGS